VLLLPAGCATTAPGAQPGPTDSVPTPSAAPPSPSPPTYQLGHPAQADNGQVAATVFAYRQPAGPPTAGDAVWGAADVQVCVQPNAIFDVSVSRGPWQLLSRSGHAIPPSLASDAGFPQPPYPVDHRQLKSGECVRGWIAFPVPTGERPTAVRYAPSGAQPVIWAVS